MKLDSQPILQRRNAVLFLATSRDESNAGKPRRKMEIVFARVLSTKEWCVGQQVRKFL